MDLSTQYLGLTLKNPLVPSASPLSRELDTAKRLEDAGASAIVMYSLFEEEIRHEDELFDTYLLNQDIGHAEADSYRPFPDLNGSITDNYLTQLNQLKQSLEIPVIASLNGVSPGGWIERSITPSRSKTQRPAATPTTNSPMLMPRTATSTGLCTRAIWATGRLRAPRCGWIGRGTRTKAPPMR